MDDNYCQNIINSIHSIKQTLPKDICFLYSMEEERESRIRYISGICTKVTEYYIIVDDEKYIIEKIQSTLTYT